MDQDKVEIVSGIGIMVTGIAAILWAVLATGCGGVAHSPSPWQDGSILISADEKGMRSFGDMITGIGNEARTPAGIKSSHYQLREMAVQEETKRELAPGFLSKLFSKGN